MLKQQRQPKLNLTHLSSEYSKLNSSSFHQIQKEQTEPVSQKFTNNSTVNIKKPVKK
jgi:hypothetical protein